MTYNFSTVFSLPLPELASEPLHCRLAGIVENMKRFVSGELLLYVVGKAQWH
ncbi:MAG: hypothetical protein KY468_08200 [Armatimonadetes bacterium]|nr:hypothetical protein [Armatimonadota bacterium]